MKRASSDSGSLDMLLDTMCNTFGGVCFIALMVALISATLPKGDAETAAPQVTEEQLAAKEAAQLRQRRDRLKVVLEIQSAFVAQAATNALVKTNLAQTAQKVASSEEQIRLYEKKRVEYLDELAQLKTRTAYSRREALRLERVLKALKEKVGKPLFDRHRVVRTPHERELQGLTSIDVWLHDHRLYVLRDKRDVSCETVTSDEGKMKWDYRLIPGRGVPLNDDFFQHGEAWPALRKRFGRNTFVRIFVDAASFEELCLLRDALIFHKLKYNWSICEDDVLHFVEGYDGYVQ